MNINKKQGGLCIYGQGPETVERYLNPADINLPAGYTAEVFVQGIDAPSSIVFTEDGDIFIAESGYVSDRPRILLLRGEQFEVFSEGFESPITGINYRNRILYVSHKGRVTTIGFNREKHTIIAGLPSLGDHWNSIVAFGNDEKIYFGQGTVTNSGVVGEDNKYWLGERPFLHDYPGGYIILNGQNFETTNVLTGSNEIVRTGAFSPYGVPNLPNEVRKGIVKASGSILRANLDGTDLELYAWGFRFPGYIRFDRINRLFTTNQGYDSRGSRPIANAPDEFHQIRQGLWYGWPDYAGGEPVTSSRFQQEGRRRNEFLLTNHPNVPPRPFATFQPNSYVYGFDFNYNAEFGPYGDAYVAEFGGGGRIEDGEPTPYAGRGHRISRVNMDTGGITTFAINRSGFPSSITGEGGFGRPVEVVFGPDGAMYVVDMGTNAVEDPSYYFPYTGVIWRISRT